MEKVDAYKLYIRPTVGVRARSKEVQNASQSARCTLKTSLSIVGGLFLVIVLFTPSFVGSVA